MTTGSRSREIGKALFAEIWFSKIIEPNLQYGLGGKLDV